MLIAQPTGHSDTQILNAEKHLIDLQKKPERKRATFARETRILQAFQFKAVFDQPIIKVHQPSFTILAIPSQYRVDAIPCALDTARLGLIIAKKKIKRSHERNRVKRLFRESFRLNRHLMPAYDLVMIAKSDAQTISNVDVFQHLATAWQQLIRKSQKINLVAPS